MSPGSGLNGIFFLLAVRRLRSFRATRRSSSLSRRIGTGIAPLGLVTLGLAGCLNAIESGPPIANPADLAGRVRYETGATVPVTLRFDWRYADRRGDIGGDGVGRYNPPDSLRVDLFTSGDVAMAIAVANGELRSLGEIEDVEIPGLEFVYAMAGLFRPGDARAEGFVAGADSVLVYGGGPERKVYFYVRDGQLRRVEERVRGRTVQRVNLEWEGSTSWPSEAEYRNLEEHSRVRWRVEEITNHEESHPAHAYDLPLVQ